MRMRIAVVPVAIVVALALAGCSSDKSSTASSATTTAGSATTVASGNGGASSKFCQLGADFTDRFRNITSSLSGGVAKAKTEITALRDVITQAKASAPASVKADVQTLSDAFQQFFDRLQAAGFDITKVPSSATTDLLQSPEVQNAAKDLVTYGQQVCGLNTGSTP